MWRLVVLLSAIVLSPLFAGAQETWVVGENTCADMVIRDAVAQGQIIECIVAESGEKGSCTISGRCRVAVVENRVRKTPSLLQSFAQQVSKKTDHTLGRVGDMVTSFLHVAEEEYTSTARPFGYERTDAEEGEGEQAPATFKSFMCASGIPSFLARFVPAYELCGGSRLKQVQFTGTSVSRELEVVDVQVAGGDGLFIVSDPERVGLGERASLRWGAAGVKKGTCTVRGPGIKERGDWGSAYTPAIYEVAVFVLECEDITGKVLQKSTSVDIGL